MAVLIRPIFQDAVTSTGNGNDYTIQSAQRTLEVEIFGTATSRTVQFFYVNSNGDTIPLNGCNRSTITLATSTSGTSSELWEFDVTGLYKIRMVVSAISGGNLTVRGTVTD